MQNNIMIPINIFSHVKKKRQKKLRGLRITVVVDIGTPHVLHSMPRLQHTEDAKLFKNAKKRDSVHAEFRAGFSSLRINLSLP